MCFYWWSPNIAWIHLLYLATTDLSLNYFIRGKYSWGRDANWNNDMSSGKIRSLTQWKNIDRTHFPLESPQNRLMEKKKSHSSCPCILLVRVQCSIVCTYPKVRIEFLLCIKSCDWTGSFLIAYAEELCSGILLIWGIYGV